MIDIYNVVDFKYQSVIEEEVFESMSSFDNKFEHHKSGFLIDFHIEFTK